MIIDQLFTPKPLEEGGPYDLPGKDYDRPGDTPRRPLPRDEKFSRRHPDDPDFMDPDQRRLRADQERVAKANAEYHAKKKSDMAEGLGYSQDPAQAKWYHEGRKAFKYGTTAPSGLIQDIAKKHGVPAEWVKAFHAGYQDQEGFGKNPVDEDQPNTLEQAQKSMPFYGTNPDTGQARTYDELLAKSQAGAAPAKSNSAQQSGGYKSVNYVPNIKTGFNLPKPTATKVTTGGPTADEKAKLDQRIAQALKQPVAEMLQMVETKEDVQRIKQFVDQTFTRYGAVNESAFVLRNHILEHVTQVGAQRRREHSQRVAH